MHAWVINVGHRCVDSMGGGDVLMHAQNINMGHEAVDGDAVLAGIIMSSPWAASVEQSTNGHTTPC